MFFLINLRVDYKGLLNSRVNSIRNSLIIVEAKSKWNESDVWQCIAEVAALHKLRKDAGKANCNVWGIFSNASLWEFIFVNNDGELFKSEPIYLGVPKVDTAKINEVYRCIYFLMQAAYISSPTTTPIASCFPPIVESE